MWGARSDIESTDNDDDDVNENEFNAKSIKVEVNSLINRISIPSGKLKFLMGKVVMIQSWPHYESKEKLPAISKLPHVSCGVDICSIGPQHVSIACACIQQVLTVPRPRTTSKPYAPSVDGGAGRSTVSRKCSLKPSTASESATENVEGRERTSLTQQSINVDHPCLRDNVGRHVGRSKAACLALCLQSGATAHATPSDVRSPLTIGNIGGMAVLKNALCLFMNCRSTTSTSSIANGNKKRFKYANEILDDGRFVTWFVSAKEWGNGRSPLAAKFLSCEGGISRRELNSEMTAAVGPDRPQFFAVSAPIGDGTAGSLSSSILLFARSESSSASRSDFLYCGRCAVVKWFPSPSCASSMVTIVLELLDFGFGYDDRSYSNGSHDIRRLTATEGGTDVSVDVACAATVAKTPAPPVASPLRKSQLFLQLVHGHKNQEHTI